MNTERKLFKVYRVNLLFIVSTLLLIHTLPANRVAAATPRAQAIGGRGNPTPAKNPAKPGRRADGKAAARERARASQERRRREEAEARAAEARAAQARADEERRRREAAEAETARVKAALARTEREKQRSEEAEKARAEREKRRREEAEAETARARAALAKALEESNGKRDVWFVAIVRNDTRGEIPYQILRNGSWTSVTLKPGYQVTHTVLNGTMTVKYDFRYEAGFQEKRYSLQATPVVSREPTESEKSGAKVNYFALDAKGDIELYAKP